MEKTERTKMLISERAKQFMPFDALKGLREALRLKEYKHEKILIGDLSEEQVEEISSILLKLKKGDMVEAEIFDDGYIKNICGIAKLNAENQEISIADKLINLNQIRKIKIV